MVTVQGIDHRKSLLYNLVSPGFVPTVSYRERYSRSTKPPVPDALRRPQVLLARWLRNRVFQKARLPPR